ncbi:DUF262 domain-containing protein [Paludibaculum fermentans]|uniref:DUF262 domain-containing protein n=1 Tax=Paludibaculum fermentans TaxID=1473598 RepID=UPI003EB71245
MSAVPSQPRRQNFQTISWFSDLYKRKLLELDPPYQRRSVWNQAYKDDFIDTVLLQYPAPAIFLYEEVSPEGVSIYQLVDGKQRLKSVLEFAAGEYPVSEKSPVSNLRGKYFAQFPPDEKTAFWTYQFPIEYLPTNNETIINTIFERINKNVARLTRQELRHARLNGIFITTVEELAEYLDATLPEGFPRVEGQARKQMKDVELVANILLSLERGVKSFSQDELDVAFSERDDNWPEATLTRKAFSDAINCVDKLCRRPADSPLHKTRLRNQADFYSFVTAVAEYNQSAALDCNADIYVQRLVHFLTLVDNEEQRNASEAAREYFRAARSNSNDTGPRRQRHEIMLRVLRGTVGDYSSADNQQVQGD